jgi:hypothetical protein
LETKMKRPLLYMRQYHAIKQVTPHKRNVDTRLKCVVSYKHGPTLLRRREFQLPFRHEVEWLALTLHSTKEKCQLTASSKPYISLPAQKAESYFQINIKSIDSP